MNKIFLCIALLLSLSINTFSQKTYTLKDCINTAITNNYDILLTHYQKQTANAKMKSAFGSYLPSVDVTAGYSRQLNNPNNSLYLNSYSMNAGANMLIFDGFGREANYRIADINTNIVDLQTEYLIEKIKLDIYLKYAEIMRLEEIRKAKKEDIEVGKIELENLKAKYEAGIIPINSILSQEAELGNKEVQLLQSEIDINLAKQSLMITLGLDPSVETNFDTNSIPANISTQEIDKFRNQIGGLQNSIEQAFKNRIDYSTYTLNKESAELGKKAANSAYFPTLSASLGYNWSSGRIADIDKGLFLFGLNLNVPIFKNFNIDLQAQQAELYFQEANTELLKLEQGIRAEVQTAYFNLEAVEKAVAISEKSIAAARQNFDAVKERMNLGSATITDYITANTQYITAQTNSISSYYLYLKAQQNLLFVIGNYDL